MTNLHGGHHDSFVPDPLVYCGCDNRHDSADNVAAKEFCWSGPVSEPRGAQDGAGRFGVAKSTSTSGRVGLRPRRGLRERRDPQCLGTDAT